jgi:cytochrome P450
MTANPVPHDGGSPSASPAGALPPGPKGRFFLGSLPDFAGDILGFMTRMPREHGDVVHFRLPGNRVFLLQNPRDIETVLLTQRANFIKHTFFWKHVTAIFGNGLLTSEGDFWLKQRRLSAPAFHPDRIAGYGSVMSSFAERMGDRWRDGETRDIHRDFMRSTMEIVAKTLFDVEVEADVEEVGTAFDLLIREIAARFRRPVKIPDWVPTPGNRRYSRGVASLDRLIRRILADRRAHPGDRGDLLSMLLAARDDDGQPMSDRQLRDELVTLFLAGHETTAITLSWTFFLLAKNPHVEEVLHREVVEAVGDRLPGAQDLPRLRFAESVVKESLRLYPPAYAVGREALADCRIGEWRIPARSTIYFSPWSLHRDARWFENADEFRPARWLDGSATRLPKYSYIPFGGGPRICIGERFAMMEAILVVATLVRRFRLEMAGADPIPFPSITLRPEGGPLMRVLSR